MSLKDDNNVTVVYDNLYDFNKFDIVQTKFSSLTKLQYKIFDCKTYEKEAPVRIKNDLGQDTEKIINHKNYIRWRYSKEDLKNETKFEYDKDLNDLLGIKDKSNKPIESNTRIIEWSDGTFQMTVGDTYFDIMISETPNSSLGIIDLESDIVSVGKPISKKMILRANEDFSSDSDFLKTSNILTCNNSKLSHNFYNTNAYVKEENILKHLKNGTGNNKNNNNDFSKKKRYRS